MHNLDHLYVSFRFSDSSAFFLQPPHVHSMRLKKRPLYHDHVYSLLDIFALHSSARCIATFAIYMRCSRICRIITDLQKKLILETVQCMYGRVSKVIYCLCTFFSSFLFLILQFDIPSWCFMAFYSFLSFFFDLLFAGVFHSHRVDVDVNKSRIETREKRWKEVEKRVNTFL